MTDEFRDWEATIGERLRKLREARGMSLRALAEEVGVSHMAIQHWEQGQATPHKKNVSVLARFFNVKPSYIYTGEQIKDTRASALINDLSLLSDSDLRLVASVVNRLLDRDDQQKEETESC